VSDDDLDYLEAFVEGCTACGIPAQRLSAEQALRHEPNLNGCGYSRTSEECLLMRTFRRTDRPFWVRETWGYRDNLGFCAVLAG